ncbi:Kif9 kinesin [Volvox carteri f. nagariensis]|uniref:Kinesin-like protein n=1 Tax=Volvox carteri f. nagariensis TaxID=3068 RepID=D8U5Y4_VOLCA|nr:Kif9 kinesin [Volvox carteri f. nagariensis]EFJ44765.1 Kif9 kinesin [Volvox carteri f. nagariensis]|eukprot:XP_002954048.1 Kif9 kinesin [Volvox carteri f. nagariensis]
MCYGQTGAGKTFTMSGGKQSYKQRGIIPRALGHVFSEVKSMPDREAKISIQYLEIYNEALYDLLDITTQPHEISIYESSRGVVTVSGLRTAVVTSEAEALALLFEGETNRVIGEHQLNRESSRSHSIFTIMIELRPLGEAGGDVLLSRVALVDLAGSERVSKTKSEGLVLREAGHINKSLSILEQVILGLGDKNRDHVPFRSCKLTHVLKNSLGGNCRTVLVANVWSDVAQTDETVSTCRFAQRMMRVTCEISANVVQDSSARVRQLERQVAELQQELAMHDAMAMRSGMQYTPYNAAQRGELRSRVLDFLMADGGDAGGAGPGGVESIDPLELHSLRHMREILLACRVGAAGGGLGWKDRVSSVIRRPSSAGSSTGVAAAAARQPSGNGYGGGHGGAGGILNGPGLVRAERPGNAGVAPDDFRPMAPDRWVLWLTALEDYKAGPGALKARLLADNRAKLKTSRTRAKELGLAVNAAKRELDSLKTREEELKRQRVQQRGEGSQVLDAEEYDILMRIKELKVSYKENFNELQIIKSEVDYTQGLVEQCNKELLLEFAEWYESTYGRPPADDGGDDDASSSPRCGPSPLQPSAAMASTGPVASARAAGARYPPPQPLEATAGTTTAGRTAMAPPSPSGSSVSAGSSRGAGAAAAAAVRMKPRAGGGKVPLSSLVAPSGEELSSPQAMAYYNAQQMLLQKTTGVVHRPGSVKKTRPTAAFGGGARG